MSADFAGDTSRLYARYRRDLPEDQAAQLAELLGLHSGDVVVDLGCGTGQLAVPLSRYSAIVVGLDPEPGMLTGLRQRATPGVLPMLGADTDLPTLGPLLGAGGHRAGAGAVVIGVEDKAGEPRRHRQWHAVADLQIWPPPSKGVVER